MNYFTYKVIHLASLALMFSSFGLILVSVAIGDSAKKFRKVGYILHGISWLAIFISAFGLVSALGLHMNFPVWAKIKTAIWVVLGLWAFVIKKKSQWTYSNMTVLSVLGIAAIWLAVAKPMF